MKGKDKKIDPVVIMIVLTCIGFFIAMTGYALEDLAVGIIGIMLAFFCGAGILIAIAENW